MCILSFRLIFAAGLATIISGAAIADDNIALRGGETADLGSLYWVSNCRSTLAATPTVEVMDGPAELSLTVKPQKVLPRKFNCAKPVDGGELSISAADDIKSRATGKMIVRVKYPTRDGERQQSRTINYALFPKKDADKPEPKP